MKKLTLSIGRFASLALMAFVLPMLAAALALAAFFALVLWFLFSLVTLCNA